MDIIAFGVGARKVCWPDGYGATWNGRVNRDQLRDCCNLLGKLVPLIIQIMLDNPDTLWGDANYPVIG